jgi:hypothetical protein
MNDQRPVPVSFLTYHWLEIQRQRNIADAFADVAGVDAAAAAVGYTVEGIWALGPVPWYSQQAQQVFGTAEAVGPRKRPRNRRH